MGSAGFCWVSVALDLRFSLPTRMRRTVVALLMPLFFCNRKADGCVPPASLSLFSTSFVTCFANPSSSWSLYSLEANPIFFCASRWAFFDCIRGLKLGSLKSLNRDLELLPKRGEGGPKEPRTATGFPKVFSLLARSSAREDLLLRL
jgi:hypothetical protein